MSYIREGINDYGTPVSWFNCDDCGDEFSVCPAVPEDQRDEWDGCMADTCTSYDIERDVSIFFEPMAEAGLIVRSAPKGNEHG